MVKIIGVTENSIAQKHSIKSGDMLISVNGFEIEDLFDYKFYISESKVTLILQEFEPPHEIYKIALRKSKYSDIGLEFATYMMDEKKTCKNKCIFCFIDQMPKNPKLRDTLYFKDDDERLSFLHGNYITLTNLKERHINRILKMRISPINISVHTTNPELRCKMMNNKFAGETLAYVKKLADGDINLNAQIVLCKNINDGAELERSLKDLCAFYPSIRSIAVVPSGLTKYRKENGLYPLEPLIKTDCEKIICLCDKLGEENISRWGERLIYCSDEIFLKAEIAIPQESYYEDYPQIENGVGMLRDFISEFYGSFDKYGKDYIQPQKKTKIALATGVAAYPVIKTLIGDITEKFSYLDCKVYRIENNFFGNEVTVAGLITGGDLIEQLMPYKENLGEKLLIPSAMLRYERDLFLDGVSVDEVAERLEIEVVVVENNAEDLFDCLLSES